MAIKVGLAAPVLPSRRVVLRKGRIRMRQGHLRTQHARRRSRPVPIIRNGMRWYRPRLSGDRSGPDAGPGPPWSTGDWQDRCRGLPGNVLSAAAGSMRVPSSAPGVHDRCRAGKCQGNPPPGVLRPFTWSTGCSPTIASPPGPRRAISVHSSCRAVDRPASTEARRRCQGRTRRPPGRAQLYSILNQRFSGMSAKKCLLPKATHWKQIKLSGGRKLNSQIFSIL